ncbi:hypothetical protein MMG03_001293 [Fibrobacter succinogenes]|nr:hypothetical protein [Fibrobacter succinogenes]
MRENTLRRAKRVQPGTGDNLTRDDIADGYTDYVIWNRLAPESLDIDGDMPMECIDSGMILLKEDSFDVLGMVMRYAYGQNAPGAIPLLW